MIIKLPNGLLDGQDHFDHVKIDELRGKQQDYLADQELVDGYIGHVPKILEDMILSIQTKEGLEWKGNVSEAIWKLPSGDLETILVKVRENTYGSKYHHEAICEHCEHHIKNLVLQLKSLKISKYPLKDMLNPKTVTLPKSKQEVELRPVYLKDLFEIIKISNTKKKELVTSLIPLSIKSIKTPDGENVISPVKAEHVENLTASDLMYLQEKTEKIKLEGSIDTDIEIECSSCKKDFTMKLNVFDPSFFAPTKGSITGTT